MDKGKDEGSGGGPMDKENMMDKGNMMGKGNDGQKEC